MKPPPIIMFLCSFALLACEVPQEPAPTPEPTEISDTSEQNAPDRSAVTSNENLSEDEQLYSDKSLPLDTLSLAEGFNIELYAGNISGARSMALSPNGTLFVGTRRQGNIYAIQDRNQNFKADQVTTIASGLNSPNGVALKDGDLYVAEINRILVYRDIENTLENPPQPEVFRDDFPTDTHHGWKFIRFSPEGELYVPVGAPCNICLEEDPIYSTITKLSADGSEREIIANGIRNTVGFDWNPTTGQLWFTDNGADWLGNNQPNDELNRVSQEGEHFGFPHCHDGRLSDTDFGDRPCSEFTPPEISLGPHVAALGMRFYTGEQFPTEYRNQVFIAEHGSWNRTPKSGYKVSLVTIENDQATSYEPFIEGWLQGSNHWGRPVDIQLLPDGSLLISDDYADAIYRVSYNK